jgi:hypothetical protein
MSNSFEKSAVRFASGMLVLAVGVGIASSSLAAAGSEPSAVRCEIHVKERAGGVTLEGIAFAETAIKGSYQLVVTKSGGGGSSNINQGGEFQTAVGRNTSLGTVMLSGNGGSYNARLKVMWDGHSTECSEKVRGSL